ncbi:MAG: 1-acyl-sn-glycerol-3-phosphate acyltransferase [Bacteroidota bacterium]
MNPLRRVFLTVRVGLAGLAFLGTWIGCLLIGTILVPLSRWRHRGLPVFEQAAACQRWLQRGFVLLCDFMRVCGLLHFNPRGIDGLPSGSRYVMVANHPTLVDVAALVAVFGRVTCIAKTALFRSPVMGGVLRACAYLDGGDGSPFGGAFVLPQAMERLEAGMPVLVFPEGTRSPLGGLHPFRRGAFEIACRANVDVLPVLIRCDPPALGKGRPWYDIPPSTAFLTIKPLPPMRPSEYSGDAGMMAAAFEATCRRHLGLPPHNETKPHE